MSTFACVKCGRSVSVPNMDKTDGFCESCDPLVYDMAPRTVLPVAALLALELIDQGLSETLAQACAAAILERFTVQVRS